MSEDDFNQKDSTKTYPISLSIALGALLLSIGIAVGLNFINQGTFTNTELDILQLTHNFTEFNEIQIQKIDNMRDKAINDIIIGSLLLVVTYILGMFVLTRKIKKVQVIDKDKVIVEPITKKKRMGTSQEDKSIIYVLSIQILFAIIIGISFIDYNKELVPLSINFETGMIFVAYTTVFTSLVGYSISIKFRFHQNVSRFVLDVILLYLYFQLVYSPLHSFEYFLAIYPWIFGIYVIWQILEYREWKDAGDQKLSKAKSLKTIIPTILITVAFVIIYFIYSNFTSKMQKISTDGEILQYRPVSEIEIWILLIVFSLVIGFRLWLWKGREFKKQSI